VACRERAVIARAFEQLCGFVDGRIQSGAIVLPAAAAAALEKIVAPGAVRVVIVGQTLTMGRAGATAWPSRYPKAARGLPPARLLD